MQGLGELGPAPIEALLARVYDDVPARLHAMAARSLLAHLIKLRDENQAVQVGAAWSLVAGLARRAGGQG